MGFAEQKVHNSWCIGFNNESHWWRVLVEIRAEAAQDKVTQLPKRRSGEPVVVGLLKLKWWKGPLKKELAISNWFKRLKEWRQSASPSIRAQRRLCFKQATIDWFSIGQRPAKRSVKYFIPLLLWYNSITATLARNFIDAIANDWATKKSRPLREAMEAVRSRDGETKQQLHNAGKSRYRRPSGYQNNCQIGQDSNAKKGETNACAYWK